MQQLAGADPKPHVILTGGDPLKRKDLFDLISTAQALGMGVSVSPSATPLLTEDAIERLKAASVSAISLSLDAPTAERHDGIRGVEGCFERTLAAARKAKEVGLAFQVNTLVAAQTVKELPAMAGLVKRLGADRWSLFFLIQVGRGKSLEPIDAEETERVLTWLAERAREPGPIVTTTEAPHFRRVLLRQQGPNAAPGHSAGIRDGNGVMFIAHDGAISPSGFLPLFAGNVKLENPLTVYRDSELFRSLRDVDHFHGRCGRCEFRRACGGSRARAFAETGDPIGEDPSCVHEPTERESSRDARPRGKLARSRAIGA